MNNHPISYKANRVLNVILLAFLLILIRVWYLSCLQHEEHLEKARKPKRRTVIERIERASIRDRFGIPLAMNKIQYNIAICYADIRQIPSVKWEIGTDGKRTRIQKRSQYIHDLAQKLASELRLETREIEDLIHGKASLFPHTPFVVKEHISEEEYYKLKALEKDWVGIRTERSYHRFYPLGKVGCDVIGHLGSISSAEYLKIAQEMKTLHNYFLEKEGDTPPILPKGFMNPWEVKERLKSLQEKSYTIHDLIGKAGIEGSFDAELRGYPGKKIYETDTKGSVIRELPGSRPPIPGHCLHLSISSELQQFAEELLIANETVRELRHADGSPDLSTPWIKGSALVALDPKTGEVLALASYPRIDPNDFISSSDPQIREKKQYSIHEWLEDEKAISAIWDGKQPLKRERWDESKKTVYTESLWLNWDRYLETILSPYSTIAKVMREVSSVAICRDLIDTVEQISTKVEQPHIPTLIDALYPHHVPSHSSIEPAEKQKTLQAIDSFRQEISLLKQQIDPFFGSLLQNNDKLLLLDLCRLHLPSSAISPALFNHLQKQSLSSSHTLQQAFSLVRQFVYKRTKQLFHEHDFQLYRATSFKEFLRKKRLVEKEKKQYAKPYTDYLEEIEKKQFSEFWSAHALALVHAFLFPHEMNELSFPYLDPNSHIPEEILPSVEFLKQQLSFLNAPLRQEYLTTLRSFDDLTLPLWGHYRSLRRSKNGHLQKHLAAAFYPIAGYGYGRSQAYRQSTPQGSVFKLVVAYEMLVQQYNDLKQLNPSFADLNPLTLIDDLKGMPIGGSRKQILGSMLDGKPIFRFYKGGLLPRSSHSNIGKIDLLGAIERSSNFYFSLLTVDYLTNPMHLIDTCRDFSYGGKTGIDLPGEIVGVLPSDLAHNMTGRYAFAMGQHSLVTTPLQTAVMLSSLANKGIVFKPKIIQTISGEERSREYQNPLVGTSSYPLQTPLSLIGIDFPLFTALCPQQENPHTWQQQPEILQQIPMPESVHQFLMTGMARVITGAQGSARPQIIRALRNNPAWRRNYLEMQHQLVGKTGTAEILHKQTLDAETKAKIHNHIWFGGVAFSEEDQQTYQLPELTIVVYLRFSAAGGKEGAPLATEVVKKYREILKKHSQ